MDVYKSDSQNRFKERYSLKFQDVVANRSNFTSLSREKADKLGLEKEVLPFEGELIADTPAEDHWLRLYPLFAGIGLLCLSVSLVLYTTLLRRVP